MKKLILIALLFMFIGCKKEGLSSEQTNNSNFRVELLFEHDGIKIYRFYDQSGYHYFTKTQTINNIAIGKSTYQENIYTDTENTDSLKFK